MHVIGDVSHDIKNLLTPIQSGVWTLEPMLADMFEAVESKCHEQPPAPDLGQQVRAAMANPRDEMAGSSAPVWRLDGFTPRQRDRRA